MQNSTEINNDGFLYGDMIRNDGDVTKRRIHPAATEDGIIIPVNKNTPGCAPIYTENDEGVLIPFNRNDVDKISMLANRQDLNGGFIALTAEDVAKLRIKNSEFLKLSLTEQKKRFHNSISLGLLRQFDGDTSRKFDKAVKHTITANCSILTAKMRMIRDFNRIFDDFYKSDAEYMKEHEYNMANDTFYRDTVYRLNYGNKGTLKEQRLELNYIRVFNHFIQGNLGLWENGKIVSYASNLSDVLPLHEMPEDLQTKMKSFITKFLSKDPSCPYIDKIMSYRDQKYVKRLSKEIKRYAEKNNIKYNYPEKIGVITGAATGVVGFGVATTILFQNSVTCSFLAGFAPLAQAALITAPIALLIGATVGILVCVAVKSHREKERSAELERASLNQINAGEERAAQNLVMA